MAEIDFVGGFERLVKLFSRNRVDFMLVLILGVALAAGYAAYENRQFLIASWQKENHYITPEQFAQLVQIDQQIEASLSRLLIETKSDRVALRRFHNGKQDFTGIPFENVDDANETVSERFSTAIGSGGNLPMSSLNGVLLEMWQDPRNPVCVYYTGWEGGKPLPDTEYRRWAHDAGIRRIIICPVTNLSKYPIGVVTASSMDPPESTEQMIILAHSVQDTAERIAGYLEAKLEVTPRAPKPPD